MKKIAKYLVVFSLCVMFLLGNRMDAFAASASLTGSSSVRAGDTITLKLNVNDNGKYGLEGTIKYDSAQVSLSSASCSLSGWKYESNGNAFIIYDDALSKPLKGEKTVLTLKFKVKSDVAAGTKINISVEGLISTDGSSESNLGKASYSVTTAAPLSTNANLSSLSVAEGTLSPAFKTGTTNYTLPDVEYSVSKLNITYKPEDAKAKVSVSGNSLKVGKNTVSVTVKAEDGSSKTYKITVTRKQDPNYKESSNAKLSSLSVSAGILSPKFSADTTEYVVYLPFESKGDKFTASGKAADSKADGVTSGVINSLKEGVNTTTVNCTAEDGTVKKYTVNVVVMPQYTGGTPEADAPIVDIPDNNTEDTNTEDTNTEDTNTEETNTGDNSEDTTQIDTESTPDVSESEEDSQFEQESEKETTDTENKGEGGGSIIAIIIIVLLAAALIYVLFFLNKRRLP